MLKKKIVLLAASVMVTNCAELIYDFSLYPYVGKYINVIIDSGVEGFFILTDFPIYTVDQIT